MQRILRTLSIQARFTLIAATVSLIAFTIIGTGIDMEVRSRTDGRLYRESLRAVTEVVDWRTGDPAQLHPKTRIDLLQFVDSRGRVLAASPAAAGRPAMTALRPTPNDPVQHAVSCTAQHGCVVLTAARVPPLERQMYWGGEPHYGIAGMTEPAFLSRHYLEIGVAIGVILATVLAAMTTWWVLGRALSPVRAIRARMAEITLTDLSLRLPEPPACDEIGLLARTANQTLARLEESVAYQRSFASVVSHELRNPVASLQTMLEEALRYPDDVDPLKTIQASLTATARFQAIIDDLLVLARIRATAPVAAEPVDLGALVKEEIASQAHGVPVRVRTQGVVRVLGSRIQLTGALSNLLYNAQRHADSAIEVTATTSDGQAVVTVTDDGDGIAPEDRERVFEPFVRLDDGRRRDPGGSGLGLAVSRTVADAHHGSLRIEDSPRGARFVLRLPLLISEPPSPQP